MTFFVVEIMALLNLQMDDISMIPNVKFNLRW